MNCVCHVPEGHVLFFISLSQSKICAIVGCTLFVCIDEYACCILYSSILMYSIALTNQYNFNNGMRPLLFEHCCTSSVHKSVQISEFVG